MRRLNPASTESWIRSRMTLRTLSPTSSLRLEPVAAPICTGARLHSSCCRPGTKLRGEPCQDLVRCGMAMSVDLGALPALELQVSPLLVTFAELVELPLVELDERIGREL